MRGHRSVLMQDTKWLRTDRSIMPTGLEVVDKTIWVIATYRPTYNNKIGELRCHPEQYPHQCDCSGLICCVARLLSIGVGCVSSAWFAQIGHERGLGVSIDYALAHAGHLLIRGPNEGQQGYGNLGHIGISVGDKTPTFKGHSIEARGTFSGVDIFDADDIAWSYAMKFPGVTYPVVAPKPPDVTTKTSVYEEDEVYWLPKQSNDNFRPIGIQVINHNILVYNVGKNPFKEGTLVVAMNGNGHKLILPLAAGEEVMGATRWRPDGTVCPPEQPIEIVTNLPAAPDTRGQPRHVLNRIV